ncbi:hypothetical protein [Candidatus Phyllobacterium onerii]|uniref:hypothetical protein n=1 Tax=Candidatus Phyllobacterium onerii TaxID=3020828 RepID=UPI00232D1ED1|nr:hypothetical protein [Phyllobacterium sp. IY22]
MRKSATILAITALGAMLAAGSATESMAHGGGGGHGGGGNSFAGSRGDFGGSGHGSRSGGIFGRDGTFNSAHGFATSHSFADRRGHFRDFRRDDNYWGPYYSCEYPLRWNSPLYDEYCQ